MSQLKKNGLDEVRSCRKPFLVVSTETAKLSQNKIGAVLAQILVGINITGADFIGIKNEQRAPPEIYYL